MVDGFPPREKADEEDQGISTMRMNPFLSWKGKKIARPMHVDQISMEELEKVLATPKWTPTELSPLLDPTEVFPPTDRQERKVRYIREVSTYIREVGIEKEMPLGEEEWEEIAENLVRVDEMELGEGRYFFEKEKSER